MSTAAHAASGGTLLADQDYLPFLLDQLDRAHRRIWASVFIIDVRLLRDPQRSVRTLIERLAYARWRNVDVRVLVGISQTPEIHVANATSALYMRGLGLDVRTFHSARHRSTHSKYALVDDTLILGSHNWTHDAFHLNREDSIAVHSPGLADGLARELDSVWRGSDAVELQEADKEAGDAR